MLDQVLTDTIRRMIGAHKTADYYLMQYQNIQKHVECARAAQRAYREADARLQELGIVDNTLRQSCIHGIAASITETLTSA